jgi:hypothetical protein
MTTSFLTDALGSYIYKDPVAVLDYLVDWTAWLAGDTIATSSFVVDAGLTKQSQTNTPSTATVWLAGGTIGQSYNVTNTITTAGGRTEDRQFRAVLINR